MSTRFLLPGLLVGFAVPAVFAQEASKPSYEALLEKVKKADPKADFTALRMACTQTRGYNPYDYIARKSRRAALNALAEKDYRKALEHAEKCLTKNYLDIEAHRIAWRAHTELKNPDKAKFHGYVRDGLLQSILKSGDGKSPKTAYVVIATDEEYVVLDVLGVKFRQQTLIREQGHSYDRHEGVSRETGKEITSFFNIDRPFKWLEDSLKKKD